tara:strand:- start:184 stop:1398 length:1215 start_codon:yes stop_codon:yes gene_type:complete
MNKKLKVIVTTSTFKTNESSNSPDFINQLLDNIVDQKKDIDFLILKPMNENESKFYENENYKVKSYRYFYPSRFQNLSSYGLKPSLQKNRLNLVKIFLLCTSQFFSLLLTSLKFKPDFIYCHWFFPQAVIAFLVSRITKVKYFYTSHGSDVLIFNNFGPLGKLVIRKVTNASEKYTGVSSRILNEINKNFEQVDLDKSKFKAIPMGISNELSLGREPFKISKDKLNFLFIGRLIDYKGIDVLLKALAEYKKENNNFELNILGEGIEKNNLQKLSKNLDLNDKVNFLGFKNFEDRNEFIKDCDLFFVPSKENKREIEGGPLTLIEAMSFGKICIVSNSIGFQDYCNPANSFSFESGSSDSLLNAIRLFEKQSVEQLKNMSSEAMKVSAKFKYSNIAKEHIDFLFN